MASAELRAFAEELYHDLLARHPLKSPPRLIWKNYRVTAGMAYYRDNVLALSSLVLTERSSIAETLGHEFAHFLAHERAGSMGKGHGPAWCRAMRDLGLVPKVRHRYAVSRNQRRQQVDYLCTRCGLTIIRKRRLPSRRRYVHASCGGDLRLLRVVRVTQPTPQP